MLSKHLNVITADLENVMSEKYYRTCCVIDYAAVRHNFLELKKLLPEEVKGLAVIKADAYGHGAVLCAKALEDVADYFGVATIDEAVEIRKHSKKKILILGYTARGDYEQLVENDIIPAIYSFEDAKLLSETAERMGKVAAIHFAVDTGMSRIGFQCDEEGIAEANKIFKLPNLNVEGAFSHFAKADETDKTFTALQVENFERFIGGLDKRPEVLHIANSAGIIDFDTYRYDMCRFGISLYGYLPSDEVCSTKVELKPALTWLTHVTHVKYLEPGRIISYGGTFEVKKRMKVATVSIGYADGYSRACSNKGRVLINGCFAPVLGRVCMDQIMVDVSEIDSVAPEDEVVLLGSSGGKTIDAEELAGLCGTISYEILCDIGKRVPRVAKE